MMDKQRFEYREESTEELAKKPENVPRLVR